MGYLHSKPYLGHFEPVLAHDGPATTTNATVGWHVPATYSQSSRYVPHAANVEWRCCRTPTVNVFPVVDRAREQWTVSTWLRANAWRK